MKTRSQVEVSSETTLEGIKADKEAVKAIKKAVKDGNSALQCLELDTEIIYQVMTYHDYVTSIIDCDLKRITPLNIKVSVQYTTQLEISWLTEGVIDGKCCLAKISAYATWQDGWYVWDDESPYAEVFTKEN